MQLPAADSVDDVVVKLERESSDESTDLCSESSEGTEEEDTAAEGYIKSLAEVPKPYFQQPDELLRRCTKVVLKQIVLWNTRGKSETVPQSQCLFRL